MQPSLEELSARDEALVARHVVYEDEGFPFSWHHHREFELTYIIRSQGLRYVGDSIESYQAGDLVLLGPWLPHSWQGQQLEDMRADAIVLQFNPDTFGEPLLALKEMANLQRMFREARKGLLFDHAALT